MADKNNTLYLILVILAAVLIFNPSLTGNLQYNVSSSYGPSKLDNYFAPTEEGSLVVVPSFGEKSGSGNILVDSEVCIGDVSESSEQIVKISTLTEAQKTAISLGDRACYLECLRFGGSISPLFTRQALESRYPNACSRVKVQCSCNI
jgi:hypothetical protein